MAHKFRDGLMIFSNEQLLTQRQLMDKFLQVGLGVFDRDHCHAYCSRFFFVDRR